VELDRFASAYFNVRLIACVAAIGLAATIGAGATAQLGAMRINEEIDALEVIGIRSSPTWPPTGGGRVIVVIPLYCVAMLMSFLRPASAPLHLWPVDWRVRHYFNTFLNPTDMVWSFVQVIAMAIVIMLVHTYYGFTASVGPPVWGGVGVRCARR